MSNQMKPNTTPSSLYEQLQKNKQQQETEFYEESKPDMVRCVLSDEDARFLTAVAETQAQHEAAIHNQSVSEMNAYKEKIAAQQAALLRQQESQMKQQLLINPANKTAKTPSGNISTKRSSLGIAPKKV